MDKKAALRKAAPLIALALADAALVALDQWTKVLAAARLAGRGVVRLVGDIAVLVYAENKGAFLSLGSSLPPGLRQLFLVALPVLALGLLCWAILARGLGEGREPSRSRKAEAAAVALIVAGGLGNLIDRLAFGSVRDFLHFRIGPLRTGIMNLADLYILAALVVIVVAVGRRSRRRPS
jgi:signal peptidase II